MAGKKVIANTIVRISGDLTDIKSDIRELKRTTSSATDSFKSMGSSLVAAFSVGVVANYIKEAYKAAAVTEGVKRAFDKLGVSLDALKKATRGTVDEFKLMQSAVQANNLGVPVEQLATLFEFAQKRAEETGESVDYLVQSIVTGIGRKSVLILDNLGLSSVRINDEFKKMGDFGAAVGKIVREELDKMGDVAETANTRIQRLSASMENLKGAFGAFVNSGVGSGFLDIMTEITDSFSFLLDPLSDADYAKKVLSESLDLREQALAGIKATTDPKQLTAYGNALDALSKQIDEIVDRHPELREFAGLAGAGGNSGGGKGKGKFDPSSVDKLAPGNTNAEDIEVIKILDDAAKKFEQSLKNLKTTNEDLVGTLADVGEVVEENAEKMDEATAAAARKRIADAELAKQNLVTTATLISQSIAYGRSAKETINAALAQALAFAIANSFKSSGNPILGIILSGVAIAAVNKLFDQIPAFATGGIVPYGSNLQLVGERGPELVSLPGGSRVYNNSQTTNIAKGGGINGRVKFDIERDRLVGILDMNQKVTAAFH